MKISVIIPAYREKDLAAISRVFEGSKDAELIFALAEDDLETKAPEGALWIRSDRGRAMQMNSAAAMARGETLLFLHADTSIHPDTLNLAHSALQAPGAAVGACRLKIAGDGFGYRIISAMANIRSRWLGLPFGDQALFISKELFARLGGYPDVPILEDVILVERARKEGRLVMLDAVATTSPRRWEDKGLLTTSLKHWGIMTAYKLGAGPDTLLRWFSR